MITLTLKETGWIVALLVILLTMYLRRLSVGREYKNFDLVGLITSRDGHIDQAKLHQEGAFLVSTYGFLYLLWADKMTEFYFAGYMGAWVAAGAYSLKKRIESRKDDGDAH